MIGFPTEEVGGAASERAAEAAQRLEGRVLVRVLEAVERRSADSESLRHLALGEAGLVAMTAERVGQESWEVHVQNA